MMEEENIEERGKMAVQKNIIETERKIEKSDKIQDLMMWNVEYNKEMKYNKNSISIGHKIMSCCCDVVW